MVCPDQGTSDPVPLLDTAAAGAIPTTVSGQASRQKQWLFEGKSKANPMAGPVPPGTGGRLPPAPCPGGWNSWGSRGVGARGCGAVQLELGAAFAARPGFGRALSPRWGRGYLSTADIPKGFETTSSVRCVI